MLSYSVAGLVIASEIPLAGLTPLSQAAEAAAIVRLGDVPRHISGPTKVGAHWELNEAELLLTIPGLASFLLVEGREIRARPATGHGAEAASPFVTQNLLGLLMQQRGRIVLRASVIAVKGRALLFCGDSAAGKSTVAAAMAARGHPVLGDDFCTIDWEADGAAIVHGDGARLTLSADSIEALGLRNAAGAAVREGCSKYHLGFARTGAGLPLAAIYSLGEDRRIAESRIDTPRGMKAAQAIRESTYRLQALATAEQKLRYFEAATRIVRQESVLSLTRPTGFEWLDEGLETIKTDRSRAAERASQ